MLKTGGLRNYDFNYGAKPMCDVGKQSPQPHAGSFQYFNTVIHHIVHNTIITVDMEAAPEGSSW